MFHLWLVYRFNAAGRRLLNTASLLSLIGMAVGVASLVVAMAVVAGFEQTLKTAIIDVSGDVVVIHRGERSQNIEEILGKIKASAPAVRTFTPFVRLEGLMTGGGQLAGVEIQGFDPKTVEQVLNLKPRVIHGEFALGEKNGMPQALIGKALAKRFGYQVGQTFKVVMPVAAGKGSTEFSSQIMTFYLSGIVDLGKVEYDERFVLTDMQSAQKFAGIGDSFNGIRIKIADSNRASQVAARLSEDLGPQYWVSDWSEVNRNLFEALKIERLVIFFVVLVMVIAASFNIASNLFVSVLKKYSDISILRALGFSRRDVMRVFITQGLFFGVVGSGIGLLLGLLLALIFVVLQKFVVLMPVETYRVDHVGVVFRAFDFIVIISASLFICLLATIVPARRGAALDPVEGLRYE